MNLKRLFKGPWLWIIVITVVVIAIVTATSNADGYKTVKTATMVSYLEDGKVKDVTFVDGDQQIQATLDDGKKVKAEVPRRPGRTPRGAGREGRRGQAAQDVRRQGAQVQPVLSPCCSGSCRSS